jgi:hypothetical protein
MKYYLLTLISFFLLGQLLAQNKGKIIGHVIDTENKPLTKATISIINPTDSTVLSYSLSDDKGKFEFIKLPTQSKLNLFITHINAETFITAFEIDNSHEKDFGHIQLGGKSIEEVVITATPPFE